MKTIRLPGSKSITNRDFVLAALTSGQTVLEGILISDDTKHMMNALNDIGIKVEQSGIKAIIDGGVEKFKGEDKELYIGQSGTCMRFLTAMIILNKVGSITLTGEERLLQRPMGDLFDSLKQIGVNLETNGNFPPVKVTPSELKTNKVKMNGTSSSQFFTALLQIAPVLENGLEIEVIGELVSKPYIDLTINELRKFGCIVENDNYKYFKVLPQRYKPVNLLVEGDASALSYIVCFIALHGGEIKIENIGSNSKQGDYRFLDEMKIFGVEYESDGESTIVRGVGITSPLISLLQGKGNRVDLSRYRDYSVDFESMPDVSMSFMIMSIFLPGKTHITGLQTLNLKECLRIDAMRDELRKIGVEVDGDEKSIIIGELDISKYRHSCEGRNLGNGQNPIQIETYNDHRIAMCFGVLNTIIGGLNILNPGCVAKTYPNFWEDLEKLKRI
ncbi:MAG: 3-phosphoshikimate 1-carboxyvinyltransferase [Candidatus Gracilibacteria bacterium]|nr:3-phosphoshikimate 1-carboxyvinyltransferase [Candidatus Gracilibacteria bacterium]